MAVGGVAGDAGFDDRLLHQRGAILLQIDDEEPTELGDGFQLQQHGFADVDKDGALDVVLIGTDWAFAGT